MKNRNVDFNKDVEDIRVIHRKCLSVISSCKTLTQILNAETYFNLALAYLYAKYPNEYTWQQHRKILAVVKKNIDMFLTLRRRQIRKH
mgnify:CR=1 FL=1